MSEPHVEIRLRRSRDRFWMADCYEDGVKVRTIGGPYPTKRKARLAHGIPKGKRDTPPAGSS